MEHCAGADFLPVLAGVLVVGKFGFSSVIRAL